VRVNAVIKGMELPAKVDAGFQKNAKKKSPSWVIAVSTKILGVQRLAPLFPGLELCICAASVLPEI